MIAKLKTHLVATLLVALAMSWGTTVGVVLTLFLSSRPVEPIYELPLYATATDHGDSIAAATGQIDGNLEGLFILDYRTGRLTVEVLSYLKGKEIGGRFVRADVYKDLDLRPEKPSFLMLTGRAAFGGPKPANAEQGRSVVYVIDQITGKWVAYGLWWKPGLAKLGRYQEGPLEPLWVGNGRAE